MGGAHACELEGPWRGVGVGVAVSVAAAVAVVVARRCDDITSFSCFMYHGHHVAFVCMHVCMYIYMYVCTYIYYRIRSCAGDYISASLCRGHADRAYNANTKSDAPNSPCRQHGSTRRTPA